MRGFFFLSPRASSQSQSLLVVLFRALSWEEARQQCLLQGTDLAEMNTIDEQRAFTQFLNNWRKLNSTIILCCILTGWDLCLLNVVN